MDPKLSQLLDASGGVLHRSVALRAVPTHRLESAIRAKELIRVAPQTYAAPIVPDSRKRERTALTALGTPLAALSHVSALSVWGVSGASTSHWGLLKSTVEPVHLTVPHGIRRRLIPDTCVHQRRDFDGGPPSIARREGLPLVSLDRALVESWAILSQGVRRAPIIEAISNRMTTCARLALEMERLPNLRGRAALAALLDLLAAGCHSELELWGYQNIFSDRRLPNSLAQYPVRLSSGRLVYLDRAFELAKVAIELDGYRYHGDRAAREQDLRRDSELASLGWITVRWTHRRLHDDATRLLNELLAILGHRSRST